MVRGSGRGVASRLTVVVTAIALLTSACASTPALEATDTTSVGSTTSAPAVTSSTRATTSSTLPTATTTTIATTSTVATSQPLPDIGVEVLVPEGEGPFPTAVLVHGGGWVAGTPAIMRDLARFLTGEEYLTINTPYTLSNDIAGFPIAVDDVACAVRYAAAHPDGDGTVAIIGHSSGAHLSALVALDDGVYGDNCPIEGPVTPDRLVGLAGPYDVARLGPLMLPFFGAGPAGEPEAWFAGNPLNQADNNPGLSTLLMHGEEDGLIEFDFASDFAAALSEAGTEVLVEVVEGARHNDMHDPDFVGDLVITWLGR